MPSKSWIRQHINDPFVRRAKREGWRSRAAFKLKEVDEKYHLLQTGMVVVDLGAAPGGWSQYVVQRVGSQGKVIATDLLDMDTIGDVLFLKGDFTEPALYESLCVVIGQSKVDIVLCDMAVNISGVRSVDQSRSMFLAELVFNFSTKVLASSGSLLIKLFQGAGFDDYIKMLRSQFYKVLICKPKASRHQSREVYALARRIKL